MFSGELIAVAQDILIVGGAICMILLVFLLLQALVCLIKFSRLIGSVKSSWEKMMSITGIPLIIVQRVIQRLFVEKDDKASRGDLDHPRA